MRPLCKCGVRPCAVNYKKNNRTYYRSLCDKCGFKSQYNDVYRVYHIDGNLDNCRLSNLKTVCANCRVLLTKEGSNWKQGDLIADF